MIDLMPSLQDELPVEHEGIGLYTERPLIFPFRLHSLLSAAKQTGVDDIVSWDETGSKLVIFNLEKFVSKILPTVFRQSQFASFRRQMNAYGFERETKSRSSPVSTLIVYSHKNFHRDRLSACEKITRRRSKQRKETPAQSEKIDIEFPKGEQLLQHCHMKEGFSWPEVHNTKTDGKVNSPLMMTTSKVCSANRESLSRMYERTMHKEVRASMQSSGNLHEPSNNVIDAFDDELDELADLVFNNDLSGCDDIDGISWDPSEESISSLSSINSRAA